MDWFLAAIIDWEVYRDKTRIAKFVEFSKITQIQYQEITNDSYAV